MKKHLILSYFVLILNTGLLGQSSAFSISGSACIDELLITNNQSTSAVSYEWDFCINGFDSDPTVTDLGTITGLNAGWGIEIIQDNANWYGFVSSRGNSKIIKLSFGQDLFSTPIINDLGNINTAFNQPEGLSAIKVDNQWNIFVGTIVQGYGISRIIFPSGLSSTPEASNLGMFGQSSGNRLRNVVAKNINDQPYLFIVNYNQHSLAVVEYADGFESPNTGIFNSGAISGTNLPVGLDFANDSIAYLSSIGNETVTKLKFSENVTLPPTVQQNYILSGVTDPYYSDLIVDGEDFYGVIAMGSLASKAYNFNNLSSPPTELPLSGLPQLNTLKFIKYNGVNLLFGIGSNNKLYRIEFEQDCGESIGYSNESDPIIQYNSSGIKDIALTAISSNGNFDISTQSLTITANTAPAISFSTSDNECLGQSNTFSPIDGGGLSYEWSFDGGTTTGSSIASPTHTFSQAGDSLVRLMVTDGTCSNFVQDTVKIFPPPPIPSFTSDAPYCTNAEILYTNTSDETGYEEATLSYLWDYGDGNSETQVDGNHEYETDGNYAVTMSMIIPGCATTYDEEISVIAGPAPDFVMDNDCFGETTEFTNVTIGANLTNPVWNFGDELGSATITSPSYTYTATGDYDVTLSMENSDGCHNEITRTIRINGVPQVAFINTPGCQDQEVQFTDESTSGDALNNLQSWVWDFNGLGESGDQNPSFAFDETQTYQVSLTVTNTGNCSNIATQSVIIRPTPIADFNIDLGCITTATEFEDMSQSQDDNQLSSWYWVINGQEYFTQDVSRVFSTAGTYTAMLSVTPTNLCVAIAEQEFTVFNKPQAAFSETNNCDNEATLFTDESLTEGPAIVSRIWDFDGRGTSNGAQTAFSFGEADDYEVSLKVTDDLGCESSSSQTVTIYNSPTASFTVSNEFGGAPLKVDYANDSKDAVSYQWDFGVADQTSKEENPSYTYTENGDFVTQLITYNEYCSDSAFIDILVADPVLDLQLTKTEAKTTGNVIQLWLTARNSSTFNLDGFDIRIDFENQSSIFESYNETLHRGSSVTFPLNFSLSADNNNIDYLCMTLVARNSSLTDIDLLNNKGCINFEQDLVIEKPYPNPLPAGTDILYIQTILPSKSPVQLYLISATGSTLYAETFMEVNSGLNTFLINTQSLKGGMYFVKIVYGGKEKTQKVIKL